MGYRCTISRNSALFTMLALLVCSYSPGAAAAERVKESSAPERKLRAIVRVLKPRMRIASPIVVSIVPRNDLMMSVTPPTRTRKAFLLSVEASFLDKLTDDELEAAVAHELGHVWIFSHHPFLQTEELANQIAMRAVSRESLLRVYSKVWERGGTKGDLAWLLGASPAGAAAGLATDTNR